MDQILQRINPAIPTILMGDFNAQRTNKIFSDIEKFGLRFAHGENCGGTTNSFSKKTREHPIDHILVSEHFEVEFAEVIKRRLFRMLPSDHWPIVAKLKLKKAE